MNLLQLLSYLGYLEGSVWYPTLVGEQVKVRVYALKGDTVQFGASGERAQTMSTRYFLRWFKPQINQKSVTRGGDTRPSTTRSKSWRCTTTGTPTIEP